MNTKYIVICLIIVAFLSFIAAGMQYHQCLNDGYSKTQCTMMVQAMASGTTVNQNVFGVTK